jgi:DNA polymerase-4
LFLKTFCFKFGQLVNWWLVFSYVTYCVLCGCQLVNSITLLTSKIRNPMFNRAILHLDLDAFFVAVECLQNSALKGKPVIVGGKSGRGVVASCSYEARRFGVHSAMPMRMALRLCPDAIVVRGDMEQYSRYSALVTEVIEEEAPLFEKASIDEFYLDLTGMDRYFGCWKWSKELREKIIRETGLPISAGLSVNKLVSKVGTGEAKPNGARLVEAGIEREFLAPLSTRKLPSIGEQTYKKLSFMGVRQVGLLAQLPPSLLAREFGKHGHDIWKKANAIDDRPVEPYRERKSISTERTFQEDTIDVRFLKDQLLDMVTRLAFELRQQQKLTSCITVKLRYADFNTYTRQKKITHTANDRSLIRYARELFDQLYQRRQLVRLIGLRFSGLVHGSYQISLFEDTEEEVKLLQAMDGIRKRFGDGAIGMGAR